MDNIDERVAIEVMGWHESDGGWLTKHGEFRYLSEPIDDLGWGPISSRLWEPSKRIDQVWMVEEKIDELGLQGDYSRALFDIVKGPYDQTHRLMFHLIHATPEQRCQAALKAIGHVHADSPEEVEALTCGCDGFYQLTGAHRPGCQADD